MFSTYRLLKFVVGSFGLDSIFLTEGNIARDMGLTSLIIIEVAHLILLLVVQGWRGGYLCH